MLLLNSGHHGEQIGERKEVRRQIYVNLEGTIKVKLIDKKVLLFSMFIHTCVI